MPLMSAAGAAVPATVWLSLTVTSQSVTETSMAMPVKTIAAMTARRPVCGAMPSGVGGFG